MVEFQEHVDGAVRLKHLTLLRHINGTKQQISLFAHPNLGHVLVIDGEIHHVEAWQCFYHEPLVHVPASFVPELSDVLILGGGDLFAANEALKYKSVRKVDLVEHDSNVLELTRKYYKHAGGVLCDARFRAYVQDARTVYEWRDKQYDLIVNDWTDLSCEDGAYRKLTPLLKPNGVCSDVVYRHIFETTTLVRSLSELGSFKRVICALITIPEYPGALHVHTMWGNSRRLSQRSRRIANKTQMASILEPGVLQCEFYDPRHRGFFLYTPPFLKRKIDKLRSEIRFPKT
jgi:spermidine synthase